MPEVLKPVDEAEVQRLLAGGMPAYVEPTPHVEPARDLEAEYAAGKILERANADQTVKTLGKRWAPTEHWADHL